MWCNGIAPTRNGGGTWSIPRWVHVGRQVADSICDCRLRPSRQEVLATALGTKLFPQVGHERIERSPDWGLNPGPSVYRNGARPLSYKGHGGEALPLQRRSDRWLSIERCLSLHLKSSVLQLVRLARVLLVRFCCYGQKGASCFSAACRCEVEGMWGQHGGRELRKPNFVICNQMPYRCAMGR
jgi:hypothetical protein